MSESTCINCEVRPVSNPETCQCAVCEHDSGLACPTVHLNGTSRDELLGQLIAAGDAIGEAILRLKMAAPNGRDYYPRGDRAIHEATAQHLDRLAALERVRDELYEIMQAVADQDNRHR